MIDSPPPPSAPPLLIHFSTGSSPSGDSALLEAETDGVKEPAPTPGSSKDAPAIEGDVLPVSPHTTEDQDPKGAEEVEELDTVLEKAASTEDA